MEVKEMFDGWMKVVELTDDHKYNLKLAFCSGLAIGRMESDKMSDELAEMLMKLLVEGEKEEK